MLTGRLTATQQYGTGTTTEARRIAREASQRSGTRLQAGHVRAALLGGSGEADRTFPHYGSLNGGQFRVFEGRINRIRESLPPGESVDMNVLLIYRGPDPRIPSNIFVRLRGGGGTLVRAMFDNTTNRPPVFFGAGDVVRHFPGLNAALFPPP